MQCMQMFFFVLARATRGKHYVSANNTPPSAVKFGPCDVTLNSLLITPVKSKGALTAATMCLITEDIWESDYGCWNDEGVSESGQVVSPAVCASPLPRDPELRHDRRCTNSCCSPDLDVMRPSLTCQSQRSFCSRRLSNTFRHVDTRIQRTN
jgi:hypothetical protein